MDRKLINPAIVQDIASAIREKGGQTEPIVVNALGDAIRALPQGMGDNTTEVVEAISGEQPEGDIAIANAIAKGATDAAREHVWQGERATDEGRELRDGVAFVSALRGKSFKMSQLAKPTSATSWVARNAGKSKLTKEGGKIILTSTSEQFAPYELGINGQLIIADIPSGHRIIGISRAKASANVNVTFQVSDTPISVTLTPQEQVLVNITTRGTDSRFQIANPNTTAFGEGNIVEMRYPMTFDLTAMGMEDVVDADDFAHRLGYADAASLPYIPYGEQIINSKPTEVVSRGRNLWDASTPLERGFFCSATEVTRDSSFRYVVLKVKPHTDYTLKFHDSFADRMYGGFISNAVPHDGEPCIQVIVQKNVVKTTNSGDYGYLMISMWYSFVDILNSLQIEEGTIATDYTPYMQPSRLPLPLSSIQHEGQPLFPQGLCGIGDVKDEVDWMHGKAVSQVGRVVLNGTTNKVSGYYGYYGLSRFTYLSANDTTHYAVQTPYLSDKLTSIGRSEPTAEYQIQNTSAAGLNRMFIWLPASIDSDAAANAWLATNPITVYFLLATPIEVTFDPAKAFYKVQNGGTEEAVMDGLSAPLVADIAYRDNMAYAEEAALLAFANERSGQNDADLGDAIRTLSE